MGAFMRRAAAKELGSETVQFLVSFMCLLVLVFSTFQLGFLVLSVNEATAEIAQACRRLDVGGLALAHDKNAFVKEGILENGSRLVASNLDVSNVTFATSTSSMKYEGEGVSDLQGRNTQTTLWCRVTYKVPVLFRLPGLSTWELSRSVECVCADRKVAEVNWGTDEPL